MRGAGGGWVSGATHAQNREEEREEGERGGGMEGTTRYRQRYLARYIRYSAILERAYLAEAGCGWRRDQRAAALVPHCTLCTYVPRHPQQSRYLRYLTYHLRIFSAWPWLGPWSNPPLLYSRTPACPRPLALKRRHAVERPLSALCLARQLLQPTQSLTRVRTLLLHLLPPIYLFLQ